MCPMLSREMAKLQGTLRGEDLGRVGQPLSHSDRFVLVDGGGRIRGYYGGMDSHELVRLVADLRSVAEEPEA